LGLPTAANETQIKHGPTLGVSFHYSISLANYILKFNAKIIFFNVLEVIGILFCKLLFPREVIFDFIKDCTAILYFILSIHALK
jgi:hypothetical protein